MAPLLEKRFGSEEYFCVDYHSFTGLQVCNFIKKRLQHRCFLVNIANFLRTPILKNICQRMLQDFEGIFVEISK